MDTDIAEKLEGQIESQELTLKELFAADPERAQKMTVTAAGWTLDYSKNLVDAPTLKLLIKLAEKANLKAEIEKMFTGEHINKTENRAVLHTALRSTKTSGLTSTLPSLMPLMTIPYSSGILSWNTSIMTRDSTPKSRAGRCRR